MGISEAVSNATTTLFLRFIPHLNISGYISDSIPKTFSDQLPRLQFQTLSIHERQLEIRHLGYSEYDN
jgi:hypothetical protein